MDLHGIVSPVVSAVNPTLTARISVSTGSTLAADGTRTPTYNVYDGIPVQVQALGYRDLAQIDGLNLNGTRRAIYIRGKIEGIVRSQNKGGDLIEIACGPSRGVWLVAMVSESWPDWCKVIVTLQSDEVTDEG